MSGYIGTQPVPQATQTRDSFTATSGQTSFATGGYTPNFLDVYLNGVKLASADYTATNGSDVVLASGAATGDILEVVAFTTFNSASSSIDDNGNAVALTIDSSENVLVGQSSSTAVGAGNTTTGFSIRNDGGLYASRSSGPTITANANANGDVIKLYKSGTTVGSIAVDPSNIAIGSGDTGIYFNSGDDALIPVGTGGNLLTSRDNAIDLGRTSTRFKDAYIGGGVYLGGTGSANKLDDYEEGTFTPSVRGGSTAGTASYSLRSGQYTKVGNLVFVNINIYATGFNGSGNFEVSGLPFNMKSTAPAGLVTAQWNNSPFATFSSDDQAQVAGLLSGNQNHMHFRASDRNAGGVHTQLQCGPSTIGYLRLCVTYTT